MIKVLFFIPNLAHGGAERVLTNLVNYMDYSQFDVTVQTMFDVGIYKDKLNKDVKYIGGFPWYFRGNTLVYKLFSPRFLFRKYIKEKYDVIVSYLEGPSARVIGGAPRNTDTKCVCWLHTELSGTDASECIFRDRRETESCYMRFDKIIGVSQGVCDAFSEMFPGIARPEVIYNTVETDTIRAASDDRIERIVFDVQTANIVSTGKLIEVKGFDRLIRITKALNDGGIKSHLYLVGDGEKRNELEQEVAQLSLQSSVTFVGFTENPYKYVKCADLFVCSSKREGFSTAVTEALIVGTPVVSTNCSGAKELLGYENEYGIVTDNDENALYEGVKTMLTTPGLLEHYKAQASIRGQKFSAEETVRAVEEMLKEVASE